MAAFGFRIATASPSNDDYLHLSLAQQVLLGNLPVRDFIDPGEFLFYSVSAIVQRVLGQNALSEVLLDVSALSLAYGLVFLMSVRIAGSRAAAFLVTVIAILLVPRLYAYPKLLLYPVVLALMWHYADRPGPRRLWAVAAGTAVAFLFRHDHGAYLGMTMVVLMIGVHAAEGWQRLSRQLVAFGLATALLVSPFFLFLETQGGILKYLRTTMSIAHGEYDRTVGAYPKFELPRTGWLPLTSAAIFDRDRAQGYEPEPNVLAWFYYVTVSLAPLSLLVLGTDVWRRQPREWRRSDCLVLSTATLALIMHLYLMRSASESAVSDVSAITAILSAWLVARGLRIGQPTIGSLARATITSVVLFVSGAAALAGFGGYTLARLTDRLEADGVDGVVRGVEAVRRLQAPFDSEITRYVNACTDTTDRLLISWYAPELHYGSGRGFAAGRPYFLTSFATSDDDIQFSLKRLQAERVPIVLAGDNYDNEFARAFAPIALYIQQHYRDVGNLETARVLVDSRLTPTGTFGAAKLPCFNSGTRRP